MSYTITLSDRTKILITDLLGPGDFALESYHLASLLGYTQQSSTRKQILTDWKLLFTAGVDYELTHDKRQLEVYDMAWRTHMRGKDLLEQSPERGRLFLRPSGLLKLFDRTTKDIEELENGLKNAGFFEDRSKKTAPAPKIRTFGPSPDRVPDRAPDFSSPRATDEDARAERQQNYEILETLLDHLKHLTDPGLKKLALMNAELGLGRELTDIRALLGLETAVPRAPHAEELATPDKDEGESQTYKLTIEGVPLEVCAGVPEVNPSQATAPDDKTARDYLAKRPITQGPLFDNIPGVHYGLKQIGEKAGGYSAVQAGKAADVVASRMGHSHDDIRRKKLPFNDLPELPDNTSGKLRKMYRFNAQFANHVIVELRSSAQFAPILRPHELAAFGQGGDKLPNLSQGPFEEV